MAGPNQQTTSLCMESVLRNRKEEEDELKEVHREKEVQQQEEEEDAVRNKEEGDEEGSDEDEEEEDDDDDEDEEEEFQNGMDTCVYDDYKLVEDVNEDTFSKDDPEEYRIYLRFAIKTEGFYVPFAPKEAIGVATPIDHCSPWWPKVLEGAELAIAHYNKNRAGPDGQLKFVSIRMATIRSVCGLLFYLTIAAENVAYGETSDYQTRLWRGYKGNWEVQIFRRDPEIAAEDQSGARNLGFI